MMTVRVRPYSNTRQGLAEIQARAFGTAAAHFKFGLRVRWIAEIPSSGGSMRAYQMPSGRITGKPESYSYSFLSSLMASQIPHPKMKMRHSENEMRPASCILPPLVPHDLIEGRVFIQADLEALVDQPHLASYPRNL